MATLRNGCRSLFGDRRRPRLRRAQHLLLRCPIFLFLPSPPFLPHVLFQLGDTEPLHTLLIKQSFAVANTGSTKLRFCESGLVIHNLGVRFVTRNYYIYILTTITPPIFQSFFKVFSNRFFLRFLYGLGDGSLAHAIN